MFNKINSFHSYALAIFELIKNENIKYDDLIDVFNLMNLVVNDRLLLHYYQFNRKCFLENILNILNIYVKDNIIISNIINVIFEDNMFLKINIIFSFLKKMYEKENNILNVYIYSSNKINFKSFKEIKKKLKKKYIDLKLIFIFKIDEKLISGFKILIDDLVYDFSLLNKINSIFLF